MIDSSPPVTSWMPIVWYRDTPGLQDLCCGRWPPGIASRAAVEALGRETAQERDALFAALSRPYRPGMAPSTSPLAGRCRAPPR